MNRAIVLLTLLTFVSVISAQTAEMMEACQASCCEDAGGTWENGFCYDADITYADCVEDCTAMADVYFGDGCCCAPALILLLLGGAVVMKK